MYGNELKARRKEHGFTQKQVAKATGIVQPNLSAWENNLYSPNIDFCVKLADFYGITLDELIGRDMHYTEEPRQQPSYDFEYKGKSTYLRHKEK